MYDAIAGHDISGDYVGGSSGRLDGDAATVVDNFDFFSSNSLYLGCSAWDISGHDSGW